MTSYQSVAEDIEWLNAKWWNGTFEAPPESDLRRGSTTLRLLLVDGLIQKAWRQCGFANQPTVEAPDLIALSNRDGRDIRYSIAVAAGGGRLKGLDLAMVGAFRIDNPETGIPAGADVGFAVQVCTVARQASANPEPGPLDNLVRRPWRLNEYVDAPGAALFGEVFSRREIIQYFANYAGGAHLGRTEKRPRAKTPLYEKLGRLESKVLADTIGGLHFELFSIGQVVGRSRDVLKLAAAIRAGARA